MLKYLKDKFRELNKEAATTQMVVEIPKELADQLKTKNYLAEKRAVNKMNKATKMSENAKESLQQHIQLYLTNYTLNESENERIFKEVDKMWKQYCYKVNSIQKLITVDVLWFEREINRITSSKEFKDKLTQKIKSNG